jgi:hypothetical protein
LPPLPLDKPPWRQKISKESGWKENNFSEKDNDKEAFNFPKTQLPSV